MPKLPKCRIQAELHQRWKLWSACVAEWIAVGTYCVMHGDIVPAIISVSTLIRYGHFSLRRD